MVVKVKKKETLMGREFEASQYLPEDVLLTRERREKADRLDKILKQEIDKINKAYDYLDENIKKTKIKKWKWLGEIINSLLKSNELIEQTDIDNNVIWPAIGQYLREELKRGFEDKKRSGTRNDHYRKCWALATIQGTEWITCWAGWDAFTDRGNQLVYSKKLMPILNQKFIKTSSHIKPKDYQLIAKLCIEYLPSKAKSPSNIDAMNDKEIKKIVDLVYSEYVELKKRN